MFSRAKCFGAAAEALSFKMKNLTLAWRFKWLLIPYLPFKYLMVLALWIVRDS